MRSPIKWVGGKHFQAKWIVSHFPPHRVYVEPFGGGAHVLCRKDPKTSKLEVFNDIDGNLVNFLLVARERPQELVKALETLPYSRMLFNRWRKEPLPDDPFERAVRWFYLLRSSFSGHLGCSWCHAKRSGRNCPHWYQSAVHLIPQLAERFRLVQIEHLDFRECIEKYDGPETLFYCDPPYIGVEDYYRFPFTEEDHRDLAKLLNNAQGLVALSYYPHPLVDELYPGWHRATKVYPQRSYGVTRFSRRKTKPRATELLLMNYDPQTFEKIETGG